MTNFNNEHEILKEKTNADPIIIKSNNVIDNNDISNSNSNNNNNNLQFSNNKYLKYYMKYKRFLMKEPPPRSNEDISDAPMDILAASTIVTKDILELFSNLIKNIYHSKLFKILVSTTQPAHVIALISVLIVASIIVPSSQHLKSTQQHSTNYQSHPFTRFSYLCAFSLHIGSQFWMTFMSGLSLYFSLPRHAFGEVQKVLFPKYFTLNSILSFIILFQFVQVHPVWDFYTYLQVGTLSLCFLLELAIRLYVVPPVIKLIIVKTELEAAAGVGQEIGRYKLGQLIHCPHYMKLHHLFRKLHFVTAIGNMLTISCSTFHLYYIAVNLL